MAGTRTRIVGQAEEIDYQDTLRFFEGRAAKATRQRIVVLERGTHA
jgi:hypothetical protein